MGTDIHATAQKKVNGEWVELEDFGFDENRNYAVFGWLADVRNYHGIPPLAEPRGMPEGYESDYHEGNHSHTWFAVDELASFDFDRQVEDRRFTAKLPSGITSGGLTAPAGHGVQTTYRELFGKWFVDGIAALKASGAERIVLSFDS